MQDKLLDLSGIQQWLAKAHSAVNGIFNQNISQKILEIASRLLCLADVTRLGFLFCADPSQAGPLQQAVAIATPTEFQFWPWYSNIQII